MKRIDGRTRMLAAGFRELLNLDEDYVSMVACKDEVDQAIIDGFRSAGAAGKLPRDIAKDLKRFKLNP